MLFKLRTAVFAFVWSIMYLRSMSSERAGISEGLLTFWTLHCLMITTTGLISGPRTLPIATGALSTSDCHNMTTKLISDHF